MIGFSHLFSKKMMPDISSFTEEFLEFLEFLGREIVSQFSRVLGMLTKDDSNNCIILN